MSRGAAQLSGSEMLTFELVTTKDHYHHHLRHLAPGKPWEEADELLLCVSPSEEPRQLMLGPIHLSHGGPFPPEGSLTGVFLPCAASWAPLWHQLYSPSPHTIILVPSSYQCQGTGWICDPCCPQKGVSSLVGFRSFIDMPFSPPIQRWNKISCYSGSWVSELKVLGILEKLQRQMTQTKTSCSFLTEISWKQGQV